MTLWEYGLSRVYAAALIWDGLRKSVRPIAADALRTLADVVDIERFEGAGAVVRAGSPVGVGETPVPALPSEETSAEAGRAHPIWNTVRANAAEVAAWPQWKRDGSGLLPIQPRPLCPACWGGGGERAACYRCGRVGR